MLAPWIIVLYFIVNTVNVFYASKEAYNAAFIISVFPFVYRWWKDGVVRYKTMLILQIPCAVIALCDVLDDGRWPNMFSYIVVFVWSIFSRKKKALMVFDIDFYPIIGGLAAFLSTSIVLMIEVLMTCEAPSWRIVSAAFGLLFKDQLWRMESLFNAYAYPTDDKTTSVQQLELLVFSVSLYRMAFNRIFSDETFFKDWYMSFTTVIGLALLLAIAYNSTVLITHNLTLSAMSFLKLKESDSKLYGCQTRQADSKTETCLALGFLISSVGYLYFESWVRMNETELEECKALAEAKEREQVLQEV